MSNPSSIFLSCEPHVTSYIICKWAQDIVNIVNDECVRGVVRVERKIKTCALAFFQAFDYQFFIKDTKKKHRTTDDVYN
jgi:hypothetical protein